MSPSALTRSLLKLLKNHAISTIGYNGAVPAPLIRLEEGKPVTVELINDTNAPELVHWHGLIVPSDVDGVEEENSLAVPAHGSIRYTLTPTPAGSRFVHSQSMPGPDLTRGTYTGQYGFVYVEPHANPGRYDQELFLATHEFEPFFTNEETPIPTNPPSLRLPAIRTTPKPMAAKLAIKSSPSTANVWALANPSASNKASAFSSTS